MAEMGNAGLTKLIRYVIEILENDFKMGNEDDFKALLEYLKNLNIQTGGNINNAVTSITNSIGDVVSILNNVSADTDTIISKIDTNQNILVNNSSYGLKKIVELISGIDIDLENVINSNYGLKKIKELVTANNSLLTNNTYGLSKLLEAIRASSSGYLNTKAINVQKDYVIPANSTYNGEMFTILVHQGGKCKWLPIVYGSELYGEPKKVDIIIDGLLIENVFYNNLNYQNGSIFDYNIFGTIEATKSIKINIYTEELQNKTANNIPCSVFVKGILYY